MADKARNSMRPFPFPLPIGLFHLNADDGGSGGGAGDGDAGDGGGSGDGGSERTFTQTDVDRIVQERVARVKATPPADYDDLKAKAAKFDELEAASKTELEREREARTKAEERVTKVEQEARDIKIRAAILAEAAKPDRKIVDPDLVASLLAGEVETDGDGQPTNVAKAIDSLLEAKPYLVAANGGARGDADQGARDRSGNGQVTEAELKKMSPEEIVKARREGRLTSLGVG